MKNKTVKKGLVFGIIIIFIGMGIVPTTAIFQEDTIEVNKDVEVTNAQNNNCSNSLGEMEVFWDRGWIVPWTFIYPVPLYTDYYFPEQNGILIANFSVNCTTYSRSPDMIIPRCSFFSVIIHDGRNRWYRVLENGYKRIWVRSVDMFTPSFCMELENVSIPLNGKDNRTLYVELICGGHPFNPFIFEFPFFSFRDATLIVAHPPEEEASG